MDAINTYVALLRGINVGGRNKIEMPRLRTAFENAGLTNVKTYINSGNVIFTYDSEDTVDLTRLLEAAIEQEFGLAIKVVLRSLKQMEIVGFALPDEWANNGAMKCDVMFLWENVDSPGVLEQLTIKPGIDDARYVAGAMLWKVDRKNATQSGMSKLVGTELYRYMTIRNCNTVRKLLELMRETAAASD